MTIPVMLFAIILAIAFIAVAWYYWSDSRSAGKAPGKSAPARKHKTIHVDLDSAGRDPVRLAEAESIPSNEPDIVEEKPPETDGPDLKSQFVPEEEGIYHDAGKLTDRGWSDLEYALVTLSRLPSEIAELLDVLNDSDTSASHVAEVCERNVGFTARILKLVNSPFYGLNSQVDDIQRAVTLLGFDEIRQVILTSSLFRSADVGPDLLDIEDLWTHSLATARITSWLSDRIQAKTRKGLAGTGAMLHDVGKLVLQQWRPEGFRKVLRISRERQVSLMAEELKELGVPHALAGVLLLERWHLPVMLSWGVKGCHLPVISPEMPESALVFLSGQIARHMSIGADGESPEERYQGDVREFLGLSVETVSELVGEGFEEYVKSVLSDLRVATPA